MPKDPQDVLALLSATCMASQARRIPLIGLFMGSIIGAMSRIMGWLYGSAATFAVGQSRSAPGQIAVEDLRAALAAGGQPRAASSPRDALAPPGGAEVKRDFAAAAVAAAAALVAPRPHR
jgi:hypothetical protein